MKIITERDSGEKKKCAERDKRSNKGRVKRE